MRQEQTDKLSRRRKIIVAMALVLFASLHQGAVDTETQVTNDLSPAKTRLMNSDSGSEEFADAEKTIGSFLKYWSIAGASVAVAKDGKLVYARGFGFTDTVSRTAVQPYHLFRIASISKLVTAIAVMKLQEEGKLSLNDKVFGPVGILNDPFFNNPKDRRVFDITVAHLLGHEGGWTSRYGDQMFMPSVIADKMGTRMPVDLKTIVRFALDKRLHYTPGSGRAYSNLGYAVLGLVIEKTSGMSYEEYCRKKILEPLGIYDMRLAGNMPAERRENEVSYYENADRVLKPSIYGTGEMLTPSYGGNDIHTLGGAGGWIASAPDLMRLLLAVDGFASRPDFLNDQSIRFMTDNDNGYAPVGWKTTIYNGTWWRTGSFPGSAGVMKRQADGISWVILLNTSAWNGPEIYSYIDYMMTKAIRQINEWPETDLFSYSLPVPVDSTLFFSSIR